MTRSDLALPQPRAFGETRRRDKWWIKPLLVFIGLSAFVVYATWRAFAGTHYLHGSLLSPFYSPLIFGESDHAWFSSETFRWFPLSPALLILWAPGGFRFTCYYYRGAYYKAFWADPPSCAVGEPRKGYRGENSFPLILQNVHRGLLYLAIIFIFFLMFDFGKACFWMTDEGHRHFGIHVGTIVLFFNAFFLGGYTFSCHSFRHLVGGRLNSLAGRPVRRKVYDCVTCVNKRHMVWAWASLFWVAFADLYVLLCSKGIWVDFRIIGA
jgi:hypothetical protein